MTDSSLGGIWVHFVWRRKWMDINEQESRLWLLCVEKGILWLKLSYIVLFFHKYLLDILLASFPKETLFHWSEALSYCQEKMKKYDLCHILEAAANACMGRLACSSFYSNTQTIPLGWTSKWEDIWRINRNSPQTLTASKHIKEREMFKWLRCGLVSS